MRIKWSLRLVTGTVIREKDHVTVNTTVYGTSASDTAIGAATVHGKQLWVQTDDGATVSASLRDSKAVSASPGDRVRIVFAEPGAHVVGLANETLQTRWTWKYPSQSGCMALVVPLLFLAMLIGGLAALWRGELAIGLVLIGIVAFIVAVPLGRNRQKVRALHAERDAMLSG